jgi:hypothetical protein
MQLDVFASASSFFSSNSSSKFARRRYIYMYIYADECGSGWPCLFVRRKWQTAWRSAESGENIHTHTYRSTGADFVVWVRGCWPAQRTNKRAKSPTNSLTPCSEWRECRVLLHQPAKYVHGPSIRGLRLQTTH